MRHGCVAITVYGRDHAQNERNGKFRSDRFLGLFVLGEKILDLRDDVGRALYKIGDLVNGIGLALLSDVDEFYVAVLVNDKEADGNYGKYDVL